MRELPIIFNTPMVRAILDERKTQTRRIIKPQPFFESGYDYPHENEFGIFWKTEDSYDSIELMVADMIAKSPYQPGDLLWVKEKWFCATGDVDGDGGVYHYFADASDEILFYAQEYGLWRSSIHMPKEAARIWLEVEEVRVERVQDITENDADWEGVGKCPYEHRVYGAYGYGHDSMCWAEGDCRNPDKACGKSLREHFREYWNSLNTKRGFGWDTNPWVWVIEFKVVQKP